MVSNRNLPSATTCSTWWTRWRGHTHSSKSWRRRRAKPSLRSNTNRVHHTPPANEPSEPAMTSRIVSVEPSPHRTIQISGLARERATDPRHRDGKNLRRCREHRLGPKRAVAHLELRDVG